LSLEATKALPTQLKMKHTLENIDLMLERAMKEDMSCLQFLEMVLQKEVDYRQDKALQTRMKQAQFPYLATLDEFDFNFQRSITKRQVQQLLDFQWIDKAYNVIFLGPPGVGKTHLAVALGMKAIESGYKVVFITMDELMKTLKTQDILAKSRTRLKHLR
jgi:DNA replication protein DnaC